AGGEAIAIPMDIVNADDVENMVNSAIDLYGQIDILLIMQALVAWVGMKNIQWNAILKL
ncbi:MAG: hypothetical protein HC797_06845, partial [Anaerolineales bacterium]|nr:hypothetical protein [Anaerolineales bacterium]